MPQAGDFSNELEKIYKSLSAGGEEATFTFDVFLGRLTHEGRSLSTSIRGLAQLLQNEGEVCQFLIKKGRLKHKRKSSKPPNFQPTRANRREANDKLP